MNWFVAAILILLLSLALNLGLLTYAMYALLGVMLLSRFLTLRWTEDLHAYRECSQLEADVGNRVAVVITIENRGAFPVPWLLLEDMLPRDALIYQPPKLDVDGERMQLATIKPKGTVRVLYQLGCNRRGYYQIGPLVMESGDLFGLHRRFRIASKPHFLTVYPKSIPLEGYQIASRRPIGEVRMAHRLYEDPTRNAGVRRYESGDPLNRVHWSATARTGVLHSKIYEPSSVAGATIVLEFHQDSHPAHNEPHRSELAITAAASLANAVYEMGEQVGLITNGRDAADRIRYEGWDHDFRTRHAAREVASMLSSSERLRPVVVPTRRGVEQFMLIREALARLELTDGLTLPELITETTCRMPRDATVIAILPTVKEEDAIALGELTRQGFAVVAVVNIHDSYEYSQAAGPLLAQRIEAHHLASEESVVEIARKFLLR